LRGDKAETATMIPMINDFMDAYNLDDMVVVTDAGMIGAANRQALERAGLSYVLGSRTPARPRYLVGGPGWSGAGPAAVGMMSCPCP